MCRLLTLLFLLVMKANRSTLKFLVRYLTTYNDLPTKKNFTAVIKLICHCLKVVQLMFFRLCVDTFHGLRNTLAPAKAPFRICYDCIITKSYRKVIIFLLLTRKPFRLSSHSYCPLLLTMRALIVMTVLFRKTDRYDHSCLKRCPVCNESRFIGKGKPYRKFYYYPLGPRWRRMYGNANIAEVSQSHCSGDSESLLLQDVIGSRNWQSVYRETGFFQGDSCGLSLQFSTDGVNPFSGNKVVYSMWPVMLTVLNLPKRLRNLFSNMLLVRIIPGNGGHEPKAVDPYLEVVVDELLTLSGSKFYDAFRKAPFTFKVQVLNYVLDYPGLNKVFSAVGANALQGCMWCEMRGKFT